MQTESETEAHRRALPIVSMWKRRIAEARGSSPITDEAAFWRETLAKAKGDERPHMNKGAYQYRRTLALLNKRHTAVNEIDRRTAGAFVTGVLAQGRKPETVNRLLSTFTQLWRWMERRGHVEANPWTNQRVTIKRSNNGDTGNGTAGARRGFTDAEGRAFLAALDGVDLDVVKVAAVTGARLEEIAALKPADVTISTIAAWINVTEGKTASATRRIPVIAPTVKKMLAKRKKAGKERLFHELEADRFGDFGSALSKRVGRKLRSIGLTDPALVADHSWRHRARTLMEQAGVVPWVADAVLGHARPGEGLSRYSAGPSEEQRIFLSFMEN